MKKTMYLFASAALFAALSLGGCKSREKIDLTGIHTTAAETMASSTTTAQKETAASAGTGTTGQKETAGSGTTAAGSQGSNASTALSVRSKIATEKTGKVSIEYPILSNLRDDSMTKTVNALIKDQATRIVPDNELDTEKDTVSVTCKVVSLDRSKAILTFEGSMMRDGAAYPVNLFYTMTVDLNKGTLLGLSDYADAAAMAAYIRSEDCVLQKPAASKEVLTELAAMDAETLTEILKACDFSSAGKDTFPEAFSYENQGIIYVSVPVSHALGDYAIVRFAPDTK